MPIAAISLHSIYIVINYLGGTLCNGPTLADPYRNKRQTQREDLFLEITMFLGQKLTKPRQSEMKTFFSDQYVFGTKN